jgi:AraC-like DNA-binding protein
MTTTHASSSLNLGQASIPAVNQYLQLAKAQDLPIAAILLDLNIDETLLADNSKSITGELFQQLIAALISYSTDELFGLHTAKYVQPISYSVLGFITMNCETLGEAISKIQPFEKLVGDMGVTELFEQDNCMGIAWRCQFPDKKVRRHMVDNCLASWLTFARYLTSDDSKPLQVSLKRKQPNLQQCAQYQAIFNCSVVFNQKTDAIIFEKSLLNLPLNKGNKELLPTLESHATAQLNEIMPKQSMVSQTKAMILKNVNTQEKEINQQTIAAQLKLSSKTLQRRLKAENITFKQLVDQVRLTKTQQLLTKTTESLTNISALLGFSEPRSFFRWFQKHTDTTPGQYRKNKKE